MLNGVDHACARSSESSRLRHVVRVIDVASNEREMAGSKVRIWGCLRESVKVCAVGYWERGY